MAGVVALLSVAGCATMNQAIEAKRDGTAKLYEKPCDVVWPASVRVLRDAGSGTVEEHRDEHFMLAQSGMDPFTFGTLMVAWVEPTGPACNVTAVTKRRFQLDPITHLTETGYHRDLSSALGLAPPETPAD